MLIDHRTFTIEAIAQVRKVLAMTDPNKLDPHTKGNLLITLAAIVFILIGTLLIAHRPWDNSPEPGEDRGVFTDMVLAGSPEWDHAYVSLGLKSYGDTINVYSFDKDQPCNIDATFDIVTYIVYSDGQGEIITAEAMRRVPLGHRTADPKMVELLKEIRAKHCEYPCHTQQDWDQWDITGQWPKRHPCGLKYEDGQLHVVELDLVAEARAALADES